MNLENTNIYYSLQAIEANNLSNLKYRMLTNRLKLLLTTKQIEIGNTLYKKSGRWYIHYSLIDKFQASRVHDKTKERANKYKNEITINLPSNYDIEFYAFLGNTIQKELKQSKTIYSVEASQGNANYYHLHLGTTAPTHRIIQALKIIEKQLRIEIINNKNTNIQPIRNLTQFVNYITKANQSH